MRRIWKNGGFVTMSKIDVYNEIFREVLFLDDNTNLEELAYKDVEAWDSVGQMELLALIEDRFGIELEPFEFMEFVSYKAGIEILNKHGIEL